MACGGFTCSKNALTALNILYILVAFILIGVAGYSKASSVITSITVIGGIIACGVFLLLLAVVGLIGAIKHHQVLLFFVSLHSEKVLPCCKLLSDKPDYCGGSSSLHNDACDLCWIHLENKISSALKITGGIGLFFSFTEFIGVWLTVRYRNQKDPRANPSAFL
ncbi:PREDICTED: tetraspanin-31-like [Priapulus caudatus]|uniref:Tetraspanin-31-like n=1 Tax=Priapulus caudatus TaxID=37621 RepID=A0ABM1E9E3_PRICU|nr:PREDICTED: tetraspanin-31-like [Priapulus caudatus]